MEQTNYKERISYLLARICHIHRNKVNEKLSQLDIHVGQEVFLLHLGEQEGASQCELAVSLCVQQATVTRMLSRLDKVGLIDRCKDMADQRISRVYLTAQGRSRLCAITQIWCEIETEMLANLTLEEKILLRRLLIQVYDNLNE